MSGSVDERFPISSGLLNLVVVLVNNVKQHGLRVENKKKERQRERDMKQKAMQSDRHRLEGKSNKREQR